MRFWPRKRFFLWLAIIVGVLILANGIFTWVTDWRLQARVAAIRAAGHPASIADLAPEPIPADQNAAAYLEELAPRLDQFAKEHGEFFKTPLGKAYDAIKDRGEPTPEQIAAIRAILDKYPDIDAGLAAAAGCEQYASLADFTLGPNEFLDELLQNRITRVRIATRFLVWRVEVLLADRQQQQAVEQGIEMLHLARLCDHEPTLVNLLVCHAVRGVTAWSLYDALAAGTVSPELHAALEQELALHDDPQRLAHALNTERAFSADMTASIGDGSALDQLSPTWMSIAGWPVKWMYIGALDWFDKYFMLADQPWDEVCRVLGPPGFEPPPTGDGVLADLLLPALKAAYEANFRTTATLRALRIFNALTEFRDQHGHEASGLEDLSLPKEATIDPFSGEPLKLKHTDDGWVIYSVYINGVDDGGDFKDMKDWGVAPPKYRATE